MAYLSLSDKGEMCRPELTPIGETIFMDVEQMRHPCLCQAGVNFVPNDLKLGEYKGTNPGATNAHIMMLTGSNMGGKSTVLRMACLAAIIAQMGCYVPA